jgi:hypothetical protein
MTNAGVGEHTMSRCATRTATILAAAAVLWGSPLAAQTDTSLTVGAGAGVYPSGTSFNGVPISGLEFSIGVDLPASGPKAGQFQTILLGLSALGQDQLITIEGEANSGSVKADGSSTFSGVCTVDMGDGTLPLKDVPFTVTATANSLLLIIGTTNLPTASVSAGAITIR